MKYKIIIKVESIKKVHRKEKERREILYKKFN